jgi:hypothetical protein
MSVIARNECPEHGPQQVGFDGIREVHRCVICLAETVKVEYVPRSQLQGAVGTLRLIANDTTHDGRWAAGRAEAALVAMGVDPRLAGGQ